MEKDRQNFTLSGPFLYLYCNQTIKDMTKIKDSVTGRFICDHGKRWTPEYRIWHGIINRCTNSKTKEYRHYGGRGIKICDQWRNSFITFFNYVGTKPSPKHSLDRKDNNGNYEPGNVRWATGIQQHNNKRNNHYILYNGVTKTLTEWCREFGLKVPTIYHRIERGMPIENVFTKPIGDNSAYKYGNGYRAKKKNTA